MLCYVVLCCVCRDFATATRNYSKRQLKWYRQDHAFLWLEIFRTGVKTSYGSQTQSQLQSKGGDSILPYSKVAEEIMHWFGEDRDVFDKLLTDQVTCGQEVTNLRTLIRCRKNTSQILNAASQSVYHNFALTALIHHDEWSMSKAVSTATSTPTSTPTPISQRPVSNDMRVDDFFSPSLIPSIHKREREGVLDQIDPSIAATTTVKHLKPNTLFEMIVHVGSNIVCKLNPEWSAEGKSRLLE